MRRPRLRRDRATAATDDATSNLIRVMETIEKNIEVNVPVREVYNQWTQFEDFPRFMEGVKSVRQLDDKRVHWEAEIGGKKKEWDAELFEQEPDERIDWRSINRAEKERHSIRQRARHPHQRRRGPIWCRHAKCSASDKRDGFDAFS